MDMKEQKLTVVGSVDPIDVVKKLRRSWKASVVSVGPAEEKKAEAKKEEGKKEEKKADPHEQLIAELVNAYRGCNTRMNNHYYVQWVEEEPNACTILWSLAALYFLEDLLIRMRLCEAKYDNVKYFL